jgi:hemerythrin-like metal-binding protein
LEVKLSEIIAWDQKYSIGITLIDIQHQKLFGYLNSYYESLSTGKAKDVINKVLDNLINYAVYHFSEEEKVMNSIKGSNFSSHFEEHRNFCLKVSQLKAKVSLGEEISYELFDFMKDWVLTHVLKKKKKIGDAYKRNE